MFVMCTRCCSASCGWTFRPGWTWLVGEDAVLRGGQGRAGGTQRAGLDWAGEATLWREEHIGRGGDQDWLMVMWSQNTVALEPNRQDRFREKIRRGREGGKLGVLNISKQLKGKNLRRWSRWILLDWDRKRQECRLLMSRSVVLEVGTGGNQWVLEGVPRVLKQEGE